MRYSAGLLGCLFVLALLGSCTGDDGSGGESRDAAAGDAATRDATSGPERDGAAADLDGGDPLADGGPDGSTTGGDAGSSDCPQGATGDAPADYLLAFESGTRLQATYVSAEGMPDVFTGFFDTMLGVPCDFLKATDGELRCLPREAARKIHLGWIDDQCRRAAWGTSAGCGAEDGYVRLQSECRDTYEVAKLEPLAGSAQRYLMQNDGCAESAAEAIEPSATTFAPGEPIDPGEFVRGELRELPGVCKASLRLIEAEDGAVGPYEVFDVARGAACDRGTGSELLSCSPTRRAFLSPGIYTDEACTEAVTLASWAEPPSCGIPDVIRPLPGDEFGWYEVAGLYEDPAYSNVGGDCEPAQQKAWIGALFELGSGIPETDLAQFEVAPQGSERLQAYVMGEGGTPLLASAAGVSGTIGFRDTELEKDCEVLPFADGEYRCVTSTILPAIGETYEWNDPDCMQPIRRCAGDDCVGEIGIDRELDADSCGTEALVTAVWTVREPATGYFRNDSGGCSPAGDVGPDQWLIDLVDVDTLATVQARRVE